MKIFLLFLIIIIVLSWASLSIWREHSIINENYLLQTYNLYQELIRKNKSVEQFKIIEPEFKKYFTDNSTKTDSLNRNKKGQNTNYGNFTAFKRDSGMKLSQFPALLFSLNFCDSDIIEYYILYNKDKVNGFIKLFKYVIKKITSTK